MRAEYKFSYKINQAKLIEAHALAHATFYGQATLFGVESTSSDEPVVVTLNLDGYNTFKEAKDAVDAFCSSFKEALVDDSTAKVVKNADEKKTFSNIDSLKQDLNFELSGGRRVYNMPLANNRSSIHHHDWLPTQAKNFSFRIN